jgi:palmitoyl-protein thioesterase
MPSSITALSIYLTMYTQHLISLLIILLIPNALTAPTLPPLPLIIWHGLGDNYEADGLVSVGKLAQEINPGTYIYNIRLGEDASADRTATFFGNLTEQLSIVCDDLATHPVLSKAPAVNALGFSQGGQFLRAYVERCNDPPVRSLVTFGSQHNGISAFQTCGANDWVCKGATGLLKGNTWSSFAQSRVVPAQYFRDPEQMEEYLESSNFLADINNERRMKTSLYRKNLRSLKKFAMYMFREDQTVVPKESSWFAQVNTTTSNVTWLRERTIYKDDWLGLKKLDERGALDFELAPGKHMQLDDQILGQAFVKYFAPEDSFSGKEDQDVMNTDL